MSLLFPEKRASAVEGGLSSLLRLAGRPSRSATSVTIDPDTALRHEAVWACRDLIAETIGTMPVHSYRKSEDVRVKDSKQPQILTAPSTSMGAIGWRRAVVDSWLAAGNAFGIVTSIDRLGYPQNIELVNPQDVTVQQQQSGRWVWRVRGEVMERWPIGPLWHEPAYEVAGSPLGMSPLRMAALNISLGLNARLFGDDFFASGGHPSSILTVPPEFGEVDQPAAETLKARFKQATESRDVAVLSGGVSYSPVQISPNESQFLETIKANIATIARFYRLPPEMIGGESGGSLTYSNVEHRSIQFLTYTLNPWLVRLENALSALLPRPRFVQFNRDALLRVDAKTRAEVASLRLRSGALSVNEWRLVEDLPPIEGGDQYLWPPMATSIQQVEGSDAP